MNDEPRTRICPNCESTHVEAYCACCGQRTPDAASDFSFRGVVIAAIHRFTQYDGRLIRTVRTLVGRPGQLEHDYYEGRRARYVPPFELFVLANVAAWFLVPHLHIYGFSVPAARKLALLRAHWPQVFAWRAALSGVTEEAFEQRMDAVAASANKFTLLAMVPLFALAMRLVRPRPSHRFVHYLVFAVHFYCVHMFAILAVWGVFFIPAYRYLLAHPEAHWGQAFVTLWRSNTFGHLSVVPVLFVYLFPALRRAFELDARAAAWRALLLAVTACAFLRAFFDVGCALVLVLV